MKPTDLCANCGHKRELHVLDSFGNPVCDKVTEYPNGTYDFECDCKKFIENKEEVKKDE